MALRIRIRFIDTHIFCGYTIVLNDNSCRITKWQQRQGQYIDVKYEYEPFHADKISIF